MPKRPNTIDYDAELAEFFTNVEELQDLFKRCIIADQLTKRIIVIHGVGGIGKTSLLRMFRLHCKKADVSVALASGDEAKSAVDVLTRWYEDLKADGVRLRAFERTLIQYRNIQAKVDEQARKVVEARGKAAITAGRLAAKTAEAATGVALGAAVGTTIPGIGTLAGALGGAIVGTSTDELMDFLRGFLSKPEVDLLLDPTSKLTDVFLNGVNLSGAKRRLVLMLDTFEQMVALEDWGRNLAQKLYVNILLVVAGRAVPNWSRHWPGWMAHAFVEELTPMTVDDMRALVWRYYRHIKGGKRPNDEQVEAIVQFARGLPMVVNSAVRLFVEYGVEDFLSVKAEVVADLADRLREGIPGEMHPVFEAAAILRGFDKDTLSALVDRQRINESYDELRRFPFVRSRGELLSLHDSVREIINENLLVHENEKYTEFHRKAFDYYSRQALQKMDGQDREAETEKLYHLICYDEDKGCELFQLQAEKLARYHFIDRLGKLLNEVYTFPFTKNGNLLWIEYYRAFFDRLGHRLVAAEEKYSQITREKDIDNKLLAYALCELGFIQSRWQQLGSVENRQQAINTLNQCLKLVGNGKTGTVQLDAHLVNANISLAHVYRYQYNWEDAKKQIEIVINHFKTKKDDYGIVRAYGEIKTIYSDIGDWKNVLETQDRGTSIIDASKVPNITERFYFRGGFWAESMIAWIYMGRYRVCETIAKAGLEKASEFDAPRSKYWFGLHLGLCLTMQNRFGSALEVLEKSLVDVKSLGKSYLSHEAVVHGTIGWLFLRQGKLNAADLKFEEALSIRDKLMIRPSQKLMLRSGYLHEIRGEWDAALAKYQKVNPEFGRVYMFCSAQTSAVRVLCRINSFAGICEFLSRALTLADQYDYNDHLASLHLTQAHSTWDGQVPKWGSGFEVTLEYYQQALIYALRFNRFLLDEVLWGGGICTVLDPIIPHCQAQGEEGRQMLAALLDWWQTGANDTGIPREESISLIPEGIPLLEAEKLARQNEPGDGTPQQTVVEHLTAALQGWDQP